MTLCEKLGYPTRKAAMDAIREISRRDKQMMKMYQCPDCKEFHLATEGKRKRMPNKYQRSFEIKDKKKAWKPPKRIKQESQVLATAKLISDDMANHLKRLIEGRNQLNKQINR